MTKIEHFEPYFRVSLFCLGVCVCVAGVRVRAILWCVFLPFSLTGSISSCTKRSSMPTLLLQEQETERAPPPLFCLHTPPESHRHHHHHSTTHTLLCFDVFFLVENFECRKQDVEGTRMAVVLLSMIMSFSSISTHV